MFPGPQLLSPQGQGVPAVYIGKRITASDVMKTTLQYSQAEGALKRSVCLRFMLIHGIQGRCECEYVLDFGHDSDLLILTERSKNNRASQTICTHRISTHYSSVDFFDFVSDIIWHEHRGTDAYILWLVIFNCDPQVMLRHWTSRADDTSQDTRHKLVATLDACKEAVCNVSFNYVEVCSCVFQCRPDQHQSSIEHPLQHHDNRVKEFSEAVQTVPARTCDHDNVQQLLPQDQHQSSIEHPLQHHDNRLEEFSEAVQTVPARTCDYDNVQQLLSQDQHQSSIEHPLQHHDNRKLLLKEFSEALQTEPARTGDYSDAICDKVKQFLSQEDAASSEDFCTQLQNCTHQILSTLIEAKLADASTHVKMPTRKIISLIAHSAENILQDAFHVPINVLSRINNANFAQNICIIQHALREAEIMTAQLPCIKNTASECFLRLLRTKCTSSMSTPPSHGLWRKHASEPRHVRTKWKTFRL